MVSWRVPVLAYHAVHPQRSLISISPEEFQWQMTWLKENGYAVLSLQSLAKAIIEGNRVNERTVVITFDDGFESLYFSVFPLLSKFDFQATVFLVSDYCERQNDWAGQQIDIPILPILKWDQILAMDSGCFDFGAHTVTHPRLDQLTSTEMEHEIIFSKRTIEERLGHAIDLFAYPYGWYDEEILAVVRQHFTVGVSTRLAYATSSSDPLLIERIDINYLRWKLLFKGLANPILPIYLALRRPLRTISAHIFKRNWR